MYEAKIIADSTCAGHRLTTMQLTHPRIVHSEFMTHCMFARNASSSRAIPFSKVLQRVMEDPFVPKKFGRNEKGMQASVDLSGKDHDAAVFAWLKARDNAVESATGMADPGGLNVHKQIVNRLLEPWSWITVCVTGDSSAWSNYFALRCHPDAQPDIQEQAYMAQLAYYRSKPCTVEYGGWHMPYISPEELIRDDEFYFDSRMIVKDLVKISVGRCARTSYLTQEGKRDQVEDVRLHDRLRYHVPLHASPFEQVCMAMADDQRYGKYVGWRAYRHMLPREYVEDFVPNHPELVQA